MHHVKPIKPVAKYARISDDQQEEEKGVRRQLADGETICKLRDWPTDDDHNYIDNDITAYKRDVERPEWLRMMGDLEAGKLGGIVAADLDRFARLPIDLERAIDAYTADHSLVFATVQGDVNLMTPDGITMARVMVAFANKASMDTARRVKRKHLEQAMEGQPVGGWRSAGWLPDRISLDPFESKLIKDAAAKLIKGVTLWEIVAEWNEAGFKTVQGNPWVYAVARQTMLNDRLAGFRNLRGEPLYNTEGRRVEGQWEPILTPEVHAKVKEALTPKPGRDVWRNPGGRGTKKYLLSGILQCGVCFGMLYGNAQKSGHVYTCPSPGASRRSCGKVGINGPLTDKLVTRLFHAQQIDRPAEEIDHAGLIAAAQQRLDGVSGEIAALGAQFGAGELPAEFVSAALAPLQARKADALKDLDQLRAAELQNGAMSRLGGKPWDGLGLDEQRNLIASQFPTVLILRAKSRGGSYDPERVVPSRTKVPVYGEQTPDSGGRAVPVASEPKPESGPLTTEP